MKFQKKGNYTVSNERQLIEQLSQAQKYAAASKAQVAELEADKKLKASRIADLEDAIRKATDPKGDDLCWEDKDALRQVLDGTKVARVLLPKAEHLANCDHYWECLAKGVQYTTPVPVPSSQPEQFKDLVSIFIWGLMQLLKEGYLPSDAIKQAFAQVNFDTKSPRVRESMVAELNQIFGRTSQVARQLHTSLAGLL